MMLCEALEEIPGGVDFRTQEPFCFSDGQLHFADIYLPEHHTIIEVDSDHKLPSPYTQKPPFHYAERDRRFLEEKQIDTVRFSNTEVEQNPHQRACEALNRADAWEDIIASGRL